jgi:hypothetical protein
MEITVRKNSQYEILTPHGWSDFDGIRKIKRQENVRIILEDFKEIICTPEHLLLTINGFKTAAEINSSDFIVTKQGNREILSFEFVNEKQFFYDPLEVKKEYCYYGNDIVNHNCEFLGSSGTLIAGWKLKEMVHQNPIMEKDGMIQYFPPVKDRVYMMVCDVSRGKGLDYSAFQLLDVTSMPYQQVCVFRNNSVSPIDYASIIHRTAKSYNNASVLVEVNDIGEQVSHSLHYDFGYENVLFTENAGRSGKRITSGFGVSSTQIDKGIRTTKVVKTIGCSILKLLIEQNQLVINDFNTINEFSTFSKKGNSYEAEPQKHDDLVMCLVLFAWLSDQQYFKDYTNINTLMSLRDKTEEDIEQDLAPFGFVFDGREDFDDEYEKFVPDNWMFSVRESF